MACSPKELEQLADLLSKDKYGETEVTPVLEDTLPASPSVVQHRRKSGILGHWRTQMGAWGDEFATKVIQPVARMDIQGNNIINKSHSEFLDAVQPAMSGKWRRYLGIPQQTDEQINMALKQIDNSGRFTGPEGSFPPEIIQSAQNLHKLYDKYGKKYGVNPDTYLNLYRDLSIANPKGVLRNPSGSPMEEQFFSRLQPEERSFYDELERKGIVSDPNRKASQGFVSYMNALVNANIRRPFMDSIEETAVHPFFDMKVAQDSVGGQHLVPNDLVGWRNWEEYKHNIFGGPTSLDITMTNQLDRLAQMFGQKAEMKDLYQISQGLSNAFYAGVLGSPLGGRPSSIIRQLGQIVPTISQLGAKYTAMGVQKTFVTGSIKVLEEKGFISSPMEQIVSATSVARSAGKILSSTTDAFLKVFTGADKLIRAVTAHGAEAKFDDYLQRGIINKLSGVRELRDEVSKLVGEGSIDKARDVYVMGNISSLQYILGRSNRPTAFRGAVGGLAGVLMSYPLNTAEMVRMFGKQGVEGVKGLLKGDMAEAQNLAAPMRLLLITSGLLWAGSEFLNADIRSAFLTGAMPSSMVFPKTALDTYQVGKTNVEWLTGSLFNIGESDYHKFKWMEAHQNFARDMRNFVPGSVFFWEDLPKAIDEGSLVRMLALSPKAEDINRTAGEKRREKARESSGTGAIRGLTGY